jgi:hypothetical protein
MVGREVISGRTTESRIGVRHLARCLKAGLYSAYELQLQIPPGASPSLVYMYYSLISPLTAISATGARRRPERAPQILFQQTSVVGNIMVGIHSITERLCDQDAHSTDNMIGLVSECAEKLRAACLVDEDDSSHHGRPLEVSVLVPAMKTVVENLVQEHEETCGQLRREIERLEMEKAALEVAAREHMGALEVAQEQALRVAREDALLVGQRRQEELERMEMELDASRVAGEAATVELMKAREDLGEAIQLLEDRDRGYRRMCQENRMLHEMIKELRGNMLIYTRVRPRGVTGDGSECVVRCREEECALEFKNKVRLQTVEDVLDDPSFSIILLLYFSFPLSSYLINHLFILFVSMGIGRITDLTGCLVRTRRRKTYTWRPRRWSGPLWPGRT